MVTISMTTTTATTTTMMMMMMMILMAVLLMVVVIMRNKKNNGWKRDLKKDTDKLTNLTEQCGMKGNVTQKTSIDMEALAKERKTGLES